MQNLSGQKLGNYELRERLGRGGMAEVYKAYQPGMDRFVAVKVMLAHLADDDTFIERFKREARAVGKLRHPNIINIFDFGIENDVYYMVMEYLTDGNLKEYIDKHQQLPVDESLKIARDLADALDYAHRSGMIHRDVKPANVMFIDRDNYDVVLTDFGIARILDATGLTGTGMSVGTPAYMSPEAGAGEDTDERADIYALGIILYEMLVGEAPYNADTPLAVIMKHINAPLPTRDDYGDNIPETVEQIILRCLAKDPDMRYETAGELRNSLDNVLRSSDGTSASVPRANPVATDMSPAQPGNVSDNTLPDEPTGHLTTIGQHPSSQPTHASQAKQAASSSQLIPVIGFIIALIVIGGLAFFFSNQLAGTNNDDDIPAEVSADSTPDASNGFETPVNLTSGGDLPPNPDANLSIYSNINETLNDAEAKVFAGDLEGAITDVEAILENDPENPDALFTRSRLYTYQFDEQNIAGNTARRLIDFDPDSVWGYIALSDSFLNYPALEEDGAVDNAITALEQAAAIDPNNPHLLWRLAGAGDWELEAERYFAAEAQGASGAAFIYNMGTFLSANGDLSRAIPYLETYVRGVEQGTYDWEQGFWFLTEALIFSGDVATAYEFLVESDFPATANDAETFGNMAFIAYYAGEFDAAQEWSDAALAFSPDANAARFVQAYLTYWRDGFSDEAVEELLTLADEDAFHRFIQFSTATDAYLEAARILVDSGSEPDALELYNTLIEFNTGLPFIYEERADVHLALGDTEAARADLQSAMVIEPDPELQAYYRDRIIELGAAADE